MELFIENLQNNINVDNKSLEFIKNHNKNQIKLADSESIHIKKGSGNYNCQYNCYFVIEFDNNTAWVWNKDIDLKVSIGSSDGSLKTLKLIDSLEKIDPKCRNAINLNEESNVPTMNKETIEIRGLRYNTKFIFFLEKDDTISYEFQVFNKNTIDYKTYYQINYLDLLKELLTNNGNDELIKLKEQMDTYRQYNNKNKELITQYKESDEINNKLINELKLKNKVLNDAYENASLELNNVTNKYEDVANELTEVSAENAEYTKRCKTLASENKELIDELNNLKSECGDLVVSGEKQMNDFQLLTVDNDSLTKKNIILESANKILIGKNKELYDAVDELKKQIDELTEQIKVIQKDHSLLEFELADTEYDNDKLMTEYKDLLRVLNNKQIDDKLDKELCSGTIKKLYNKIGYMYNKIKVLRECNDQLKKTNHNLTEKDRKMNKNLQSSKIKLNRYMKESTENKNRFDLLKLNVKNQFNNEKKKLNPSVAKELDRIYKKIDKTIKL